MVWEDLWQKVLSVTRERSEQTEEAKRAFWAENYEGICLTKWLAQAFVCPPEMKVGLEAPDLTPQVDVGKISPHLSGAHAEDIELISELVGYLRVVNWELSCWFKPPFPESIQKNWLKHWLRAVVPHFAWQQVGGSEDESHQSICEMCGNKGLRELYFVYHPKHTPSQEGQPNEKYKLKKSLTVGSECVVHLTMGREQVDEDQQKALEKDEERRPKRRAEAARKQEDAALELAEKELKRQNREKKLEEQALKKKRREEKSRAKETKSRTPRKRKDFDDGERGQAAGTPREKKKKR